ncbi:hypothetical protein BJY04DRAFT_142931 [Aspergillus karnatakaensis]|uniref:uncharacterized protein n=1 Tax=Aspergillus karnatakaensis TaxID=1810916 RepID=UPI003CCCC4C0
MKPLHLTSLLLTLTIPALATPSCIQSCITNNPSYSWCSGNESDRALTECVCRGLDSGPLLECMRECSPQDQWEYAKDVPENCRERVFPEAEGGAMILSGNSWRLYGGLVFTIGVGVVS